MILELFIYAALYAVLVFTDLVPVYRGKDKKAIAFCTAVIALVFILQCMQVFGVKLPSPSAGIKSLVDSIIK